MAPKTAFKILIVIFILFFVILSLIFILNKTGIDKNPVKVEKQIVEEPQEKTITKEEKRALMLENLVIPKNNTSTEIESSPRTNIDDTPEEAEKKKEILKALISPATEEADSTEEALREKEEKRQIMLKNLLD